MNGDSSPSLVEGHVETARPYPSWSASPFCLASSAWPTGQKLVVAEAGENVAQVLGRMLSQGFSQLPVLAEKTILGVFSFRSFAKQTLLLCEKGRRLLDLPVEEFLEPPHFLQSEETVGGVIPVLDEADAVLIGGRERCEGVLAAMDVLRYLHHVAEPYVLVGEIEHALRELISRSVDDSGLADCVGAANSHRRGTDDPAIPANLRDMTFDHYLRVICCGDNWSRFERVFKGDRKLTHGRLDNVRCLRNLVFHFRRELTTREREELKSRRDWLFGLVAAGAGLRG